MTLDVNGQKVNLKFGFMFLRKLGEEYNLDSYIDVVELIQRELADIQKMTFKQEELLVNICFCAAINAGNDYSEMSKIFSEYSIMELISNDPEKLTEITEELIKSFPQSKQPAGKPQAVKKSRQSKAA